MADDFLKDESPAPSLPVGEQVDSPEKLIHNKSKLENKLLTRLTRGDLLERNILLSGEVAPSLQGNQRALMQRQLEQKLKTKLEQRPTQKELVERNILKDGKIAGQLQDVSASLKKVQLETNLNKQLRTRPTINELQERKILEIETDENNDAS